jgi:hypothetical protein
MSEPFLERLSRFTPDAGSVDRDALLFATGRASARPNRGWMVLAAALAAMQAVSLVALWPHPAPTGAGAPMQIANAPPMVAPPSVLHNSEQLSARLNLELEPQERPDTGTFVDSGPPLRAYGSPPSSILN